MCLSCPNLVEPEWNKLEEDAAIAEMCFESLFCDKADTDRKVHNHTTLHNSATQQYTPHHLHCMTTIPSMHKLLFTYLLQCVLFADELDAILSASVEIRLSFLTTLRKIKQLQHLSSILTQLHAFIGIGVHQVIQLAFDVYCRVCTSSFNSFATLTSSSYSFLRTSLSSKHLSSLVNSMSNDNLNSTYSSAKSSNNNNSSIKNRNNNNLQKPSVLTSPFNISDTVCITHFTEQEVTALFAEYANEYHLDLDPQIVLDIYHYTAG